MQRRGHGTASSHPYLEEPAVSSGAAHCGWDRELVVLYLREPPVHWREVSEREIEGGRTVRKFGGECWKGGAHRRRSADRIHPSPGLPIKPVKHRRGPKISGEKCSGWKLNLAVFQPLPTAGKIEFEV